MAMLASLIDPGLAQPEESILFSFLEQRLLQPFTRKLEQRGPLQILSLLLWGLVVTELGDRTGPPALQLCEPRLQPHHQAICIPPCPCWNVLPPTTFSPATSENQVVLFNA